MVCLIDTSLWVDLTRMRSPRWLKEFIAPHIKNSSARIAEPVVFEVLRHALPDEVGPLRSQFSVIPMLATPIDVWARAADLGRSCRQHGHTIGPLDLLIAAVALAHQAIVVTFDDDYKKIGSCSGLKIELLQRPVGAPNRGR